MVFFFYYLVVVSLLSLGLWRRWKLFPAGFFAAAGAVGFVFLTAFVTQYFGWIDWNIFMKQALAEAAAMMERTLNSPAYTGDRAQVTLILAQAKGWFDFLPWIFPSILFGLAVLLMAIHLSAATLLRRIFLPQKKSGLAGRVGILRVPDAFVWLPILAGFLYFADAYYIPNPWLKAAAVNLLVVVAVAYFAQGLSIVGFLLKRHSFLLRFGIYGLLLVFFQLLGLVVAGLGVADTWVDFRKLRR